MIGFMRFRTHRPIGDWPHVPLRTFQRRVGKAFLITLGLIPLLAIGFSFWAASDPPLGNGGAPWDHWQAALFAAAMVALVAWVLFVILFGIARWIMTGQGPGYAFDPVERLPDRAPPHPELEGAAGETDKPV